MFRFLGLGKTGIENYDTHSGRVMAGKVAYLQTDAAPKWLWSFLAASNARVYVYSVCAAVALLCTRHTAVDYH